MPMRSTLISFCALFQVEAFEHENRHVNMRLFKANPSDFELTRMYNDRRDAPRDE